MAPPRLVNREQLETMVNFIDKNKSLSDCSRLSLPDIEEARRKWTVLATILNKIPGGAQKSSVYWRRYWVEWRRKVRRKAYNLNNMAPEYKVLVQLDDLDIRVLEYCKGPLIRDKKVSQKIEQKLKIGVFDTEETANDTFQPSEEIIVKQIKSSAEKPTISIDNGETTPPPQWALDLENRRIAVEERIATAVESIAATMKIEAEHRIRIEDRMVNVLAALANTITEIKSGVQEAVQIIHHLRPSSNTNANPVENIFLIE